MLKEEKVFCRVKGFLCHEDVNQFSKCPSRFYLQPHFRLHLYISDSPCGDACTYDDDLQGAVEVVEGEHGEYNEHNPNGRKRRRETGAKSTGLSGSSVKLKSGRSDLPEHKRTLSMSCTDKLARMIAVGDVSGSLLQAHLVSPIAFASIIVSNEQGSKEAQFSSLQRNLMKASRSGDASLPVFYVSSSIFKYGKRSKIDSFDIGSDKAAVGPLDHVEKLKILTGSSGSGKKIVPSPISVNVIRDFDSMHVKRGLDKSGEPAPPGLIDVLSLPPSIEITYSKTGIRRNPRKDVAENEKIDPLASRLAKASLKRAIEGTLDGISSQISYRSWKRPGDDLKKIISEEAFDRMSSFRKRLDKITRDRLTGWVDSPLKEENEAFM
jgi:hypothetical protein